MKKKAVEYLSKQFFDSYSICQGFCFKSYKYLGSHIIEHKGLKGVNFSLWAPNAKSINVVGDFNSWDGKNYSMKKIEELNIWNIFIEGLKEGDIYKYEIHTWDDRVILKSDPYAYYSQLRPDTATKIVSLEGYDWKDKKWIKQKNEKSKHEIPINIYELHLGSWKLKEDGELYNFREIANEIIDYVKEMGYTYIELLPVTEHPFDGSWGYQTTGYYSVTSRYGNPQDFMYFVDKCHQEGIGVILDWVPGHFCRDEHGLLKFDGTAIYEHENPIISDNVEWGTASFDYSKKEVVSFLVSNAMFWFDRYHIDGLRVDAVSYMLHLNTGKNGGRWIPNMYGGRENLEAVEFLRKLNKVVHTYFPNALMIAEESTVWPFVTGSTDIGGLGFDFKWNMGWMNDMLKYMEMDPIYRRHHHDLITFSFMYAFSEKYILPLSHDEVVHGKKSLLNKMPGDYWQKFANLRLLYSYMIAHPGKKLLFMGSEFGQFIEWNYKQELDWLLLGYDSHKKMQFFTKELNNLYKNEKSLYEFDGDYRCFSWIDHQNYEQSIIAFMRKDKDEEDFIITVCNFTPVPRHNYKIGVPKLGNYIEIFNSDTESFGGSGVINTNTIKAENYNWHNQPYSISITVPPLGVSFIKLSSSK